VLSLQPEGIITAGGGGVVFVRERRAGRGLSEAQGQLDRDQLLPDMNAALGLIQLKELDRFLRARREIAAAFHQAVSRSRHGALLAGPQAAETAEREGVHTGPASDPALGVPYALAVTVRGAIREVRQYASRQGIETRRAFAEAALAFHPGAVESADAGGDGSTSGGTPAEPERVPATASSAAVPADDRAAMLREFPRAHELLLRSVLFPLYPGLSKKDVQLIAKVLATLP
jgi:perosamine synthetase